MWRALGVTTVYAMGLLGLAVLGFAMLAADDSIEWLSVAGLILAAIGWSILAGYVTRDWMVLAPPLGLAGLFVALALALLSGGSGDGGPLAVAGILFATAVATAVQVVPASLGVGIARYVGRMAPAPGRTDTH